MVRLLLIASLLCPQSAAARKLAREIVEAFGRETIERAEPRVARLVESYGDDAVRALRRVGSSGVASIERFGAPGAKILARWGDDGARVLAEGGDDAIRVMSRWGDGAVDFMIRHPGAGRQCLEHFGEHALKPTLSTESVVTLNRLAEPIRASGRVAQIFGVVERFGDRACKFIWRNKGTIFGAAVLAAFLADPEPYIEGAKKLIVEPASEAAREVAGGTNWTLVVIVLALVAGAAWFVRRLLRGSKRRA